MPISAASGCKAGQITLGVGAPGPGSALALDGLEASSLPPGLSFLLCGVKEADHWRPVRVDPALKVKVRICWAQDANRRLQPRSTPCRVNSETSNAREATKPPFGVWEEFACGLVEAVILHPANTSQ